jgi:hypothetical protein
MDNISKNEEAVKNAIIGGQSQITKLEGSLGIVNLNLREVVFTSDLVKGNDTDLIKDKEKDAKTLVRKINEEKRKRK